MSDQMQTAEPPLRKFTRELPVTLNDSELQTYGRMLAEKCKEQELALERKKQVMADHNARIKTITNEIKRIADARAKGEELRTVICTERLHGNVIEIIRMDRGDVVDTRPAELRDLQQNLPGVPEMPEGFDEGPRGDDIGDDHGTNGASNVVQGNFGTSSAGDTVYNGAPNDVDDDTLICDACGKVVTDDDETVDHDGSTIHVACKPDDAKFDASEEGSMPHLEDEDETDRKLREREEQQQADADLAHRKKVEARDKAEIDRLTKEQAKPKATRERSKSKNDAKSKRKK